MVTEMFKLHTMFSPFFYIILHFRLGDPDCVVPENIQTYTTEGIGNSRRVGGGQRPRKFQREGGLDNKITFRG